ncbi:atp-dependent dna helicase 2 subunit 2, partial [Trichoderma cornu-damae]
RALPTKVEMADKEASVFILDLGVSMAATNGGRRESDLDWSMSYVWDKISNVVASNRKTLCLGVVGFRTDETNHTLEEDGYENISVLQQLGPMSMSNLKALRPKVKPSRTANGDAVSAIVIAVDMIDSYTKKNKWKRQVYLVTDGRGEIDPDDIGDIARKIRDSNIEMTVLGVDFDAPDYGFKEEDKPSIKRRNEATLKKLVDGCGKDARFASMVEAIDDMNEPRAKSVKPYKTYDGFLTLGDPKNAPAVVEIRVERYFKTHLARPPTASTVVVKEEQAGPPQAPGDEQMDGVELTAVKQARTYKVNDPDAPGGKRDVEFESLAKGYEYGRTAVHISESDYNITKLETRKSFKIIGFVLKEKYEMLLNLGETCVTVAAKYDEKSELAFSSLVWALSELDSYAVARLVTKDEKEPLVVLLMPHMEPNYVCLYDVPLPFAEDIRTYQFPPLDRVVTVSGQTITKHRLLPSDELSQAMSDYVDAMDLSNYGIDQDGEPAEYATIDETYNPAIHRTSHAIKQRAVHPEKPIPEILPVLLRFAAPPTELVETVQAKIDALVQAADVKKVPPKAKGKRQREPVKPISGLDVDALLGKEKKGFISPENAVPDFKRALNSSEEVEQIADATKQMGAIVRSLVTDSFGDNKYAQAMEGIGAMREELTNLEEPGLYNGFVRDLKKSLLSGVLGGDRRDFWFKIRWAKLGLIDKNQSEVSAVTPEEADEVSVATLCRTV